jgi:bifunctional UDP-N-acetylglucosamine pyrophosphorylase/glucosamine-1-phosphate N-acetyltransferase
MSVLTCNLENPKGYGRILRDTAGKFLEIVEDKDCLDSQREITEVNGGVYIFSYKYLLETINSLQNNNAKNEYYLTDLVKIANQQNLKANAFKAEDQDTLFGVNDRAQLAEAGMKIFKRKARELALSGVTIIDPQSTYIEKEVQIGSNSVIYPNTYIEGQTVIGSNVVIDINCRIINSEIGNGCIIKSSSYLDNSKVSDGATLGPFVHFRPGSEVGKFCKIGNFVEIKKSKIGDKTNAAHLSYIGDAEIGSNVNIGCGFITCNFDGRVINGERKHKTIIGDDVFMGSDCQAVAPIKIGKGSFIASGSTITEEVPEDSFAIARTKQITKKGYAKKYRNPKSDTNKEEKSE